jgi:thioredoxin-dependent peroxiredoxin
MIEIGKKAPEFCLKDKDEKKVCLKDLKGNWVILYFYPKDMTPGCTQEACDFSVNIKDFEGLEALIIGISPDPPESHRKFAEKYKLKITLLSDESLEVLQKYGVWQLKKMMGKQYFGVVRTTYLLDQEGKVANVWESVSVKGHIEEVKNKLKELKK